ncbi:hypothetical protein GH733_000706, partial [Mirounga leonina]
MIKPVFTFVPCVKGMLMWLIVDDCQDVASHCEVQCTQYLRRIKRDKSSESSDFNSVLLQLDLSGRTRTCNLAEPTDLPPDFQKCSSSGLFTFTDPLEVYFVRSLKGSLPALKGFAEAECELWARERISALRSHPL